LFPILIDKVSQNEYQILITDLDYSLSAIAQLYRERGDYHLQGRIEQSDRIFSQNMRVSQQN